MISDDPSFTSSSPSKEGCLTPATSSNYTCMRTPENYCGYCGIYYQKTQFSLHFPIMGTTNSSHLSYLIFIMLRYGTAGVCTSNLCASAPLTGTPIPAFPLLWQGSQLFFYRGISSPGAFH